jgi:outer membrane protein OmpA-like peptidoglycan-associated protein
MPAIAVVEAVYEPRSSGSQQTLLPPSKRQEFRVRAAHEAELQEHLQRYPSVECRFQERQGGSCAEGALELNIPAFVPSPIADVTADAGASDSGGCGELERGALAAQGSDAELPQGTPGEIQFAADSSEATPEIEQQVARVAEALQGNPNIQCLAVIGHITAGERAIIGDERAATIKNLLVARGIQANRLQTIAAVVPMTGGAPRAVIEADRKVRLRVLQRQR